MIIGNDRTREEEVVTIECVCVRHLFSIGSCVILSGKNREKLEVIEISYIVCAVLILSMMK